MQRLLEQLAQASGFGGARRRTRGDDPDEGESGMARAVFEEDLPAVRRLLLSGVGAAAIDRGQRPLLVALMRNEGTEVTELLIAAGADLGPEEGHGLTPLHWLSQRRAVSAPILSPFVELLHRCGADIEARERLYGAAPLAWAGWHGNSGAAAALLASGADLDSVDAYQGTACSWAIMNGHEDTATLLRAAAASRDAARPKAVARVSAAEAAEARRTLQRKHGVALEQQARCDVAVAVRLLSMACEEQTGQDAPALVRDLLASLLMRQRFVLWEPATRPRV